MTPVQHNPTFIEACKFVADNPYSNTEGEVRRYASLAELLSQSHLLITKSDDHNSVGRDFFAHADEEDSNYFIGKSISTRSIINEFIRENVINKVIVKDVIDYGQMQGKPSLRTCNVNWHIPGLKRILQDTKDKYELVSIEVAIQPYTGNNIQSILVDEIQYLLELKNLEGVVEPGQAYYFIFTLNDLTAAPETKIFAYPIDFKAKKEE